MLPPTHSQHAVLPLTHLILEPEVCTILSHNIIKLEDNTPFRAEEWIGACAGRKHTYDVPEAVVDAKDSQTRFEDIGRNQSGQKLAKNGTDRIVEDGRFWETTSDS